VALNKLSQIKSRYITTTALTALLLCCPVQAKENVWVPPSGDTVIANFNSTENLPATVKQALTNFQQSPQNIDARLNLIEAYLKQAVQPGNSRFYGYVEALIEPLLQAINQSAEFQNASKSATKNTMIKGGNNAQKTDAINQTNSAVIQLTELTEKQKQRTILAQANVLQQQHQFEQAHHWLNTISKQQPGYPQAQLTKARLQQIQGAPNQAEQICRGLIGTADLLISQLCLLDARSDALFYQQVSSAKPTEQWQQKHSVIYQQLLRLKNQYPSAPVTITRWLHRLLGNNALHQNLIPEAQQWFAFELNKAPVSQLLQWADSQFLANKPLKVYQHISQLADNKNTLEDSLLVRLARAELLTQRGTYWQQKLSKKMALRALRNDQQHAADLAYFYVYVSPDADKALHWANKNWARAKEYFDRQLLSQAQRLSESPSQQAAKPQRLKQALNQKSETQ